MTREVGFPAERKVYRALHVIRSLNPDLGGPVAGLKTLASLYPRLGWEMDVVTADAPGEPWEAQIQASVHALGPARGNYGYSRKLTNWLRHVAKNYDAVIVEGLWQYPGFATWRALAGTPTPYFVFPHGMLAPWFKRTYPLKHLKKWLYWPWAEYRVLRDARAVIFTTEEERRAARQSFCLYSCNEKVIGYGSAAPGGDASSQRAAFQAKFPRTVNKRNVLFLGRIYPIKGCDLLIRAFAEIAPSDPDLHLIIAGPDPVGLVGDLRAIAEEVCAPDRITWTGALDGDLKWGALRCADVFALPSHHENFGVSVVEALSCSVPVLISDKVNIWREIQESGAGLVASDDLSGTINLIQRWERLSAPRRLEMAESAAQCFQDHFEIMASARRLTGFMQTCMLEQPPILSAGDEEAQCRAGRGTRLAP